MKIFRRNVSKEDYASVFYYNYICNKLNINETIEIENNQNDDLDVVKKYYLCKLNHETFELEDINNSDILYQLIYLDTCENKNIIINEIKNVDIYKYKDEMDFPL